MFKKLFFIKLQKLNELTLGLQNLKRNPLEQTDMSAMSPYSIKPDTYKTMSRLSESINVKMIYYTKTKSGIEIEFEE